MKMKLWFKYLISVFIGVSAGIFFPLKADGALSFVTDTLVKLSEYCVLPVIFFSFTVAVKKLKANRELGKALGWSFGVIILFSLILTVLGTASMMLVHLPRIPIQLERAQNGFSLNLSSVISDIFPSSAFSVLLEGKFLLPSIIFAAVLGVILSNENESGFFKPVNVFFLALSRIGYKFCTAITNFFTFALTFWSMWWFVSFRKNVEAALYMPLLLTLAINVLIALFIVYPVITRILCNDKRPYHIVFASLAPTFVAFFSANTNIAMLSSIRHTHESLGVRRRINALTHPIFSLFSRAGTAMVVAVCFIVLYRSYSTLDISLLTVGKIMFFSFALSFLLGKHHVNGMIVCLSLVAKYSAKGFEHSYIVLLSISPILSSFAALIDSLSAAFGTYIVAVKTKYIRHHNVSHYI